MEASNGAHFWAKAIAELGHDVRLISPQFVTPYVKSNKNDRNDAEAICEAVSRPSMRFVPVKSAEQLAVQAVHRILSRLVADRSGSSIKSAVFSGSTASSLRKDIGNPQRTLARIAGDDEDRALNPLFGRSCKSCGKSWPNWMRGLRLRPKDPRTLPQQ